MSEYSEALFFSRALLARICMLCLLVFAGCQPVELSRGCIRCFPPCMQQRVGQLQIDLTHTDQLTEILTQITACMHAALPYVLAVRLPAAAAAAAARPPGERRGVAPRLRVSRSLRLWDELPSMP